MRAARTVRFLTDTDKCVAVGALLRRWVALRYDFGGWLESLSYPASYEYFRLFTSITETGVTLSDCCLCQLDPGVVHQDRGLSSLPPGRGRARVSRRSLAVQCLVLGR